jgi:hypothetical protein
MMQRSRNLSSKFYLFFINHNRTLNPLTSNTPYLPHSFIKLSNFLSGWKQHPKGYKFSLTFRSRGTMCENSTSFEFLNVCSLTYLPYQANVYSNQAKSNDALNPKCMPCDTLIDKFAFWPFKFTSTEKIQCNTIRQSL